MAGVEKRSELRNVYIFTGLVIANWLDFAWWPLNIPLEMMMTLAVIFGIYNAGRATQKSIATYGAKP